MPRFLHAAASFAIVLALYGAYALIAVPLIEPPADLRRGEAAVAYNREKLGIINARVEALRGLFPEGSWQLKQPKIIEGERFKMLMQDYRPLGKRQMELVPCTIIFTPREPSGDEELDKRRAIILDVPDGALLEFDEQVNLRQLKIGRLVGGELRGRVTIRSQGKSPGPEDDLLIVTRDVQLTEHDVWTPHPVDFRWGPNHGRGRHMHIKLLPGEGEGSSDRRGPDIGGIELFEMRHMERLHLVLDGAELASSRKPKSAQKAAANKKPADKRPPIPVEVTCRGPFRFNVVQREATFNDQVDVLWIHPEGPSDQLNCELLSIHFTDASEAESERANGKHGPRRAGSFQLKPQRIEASGDPVVVSAPSQNVHARGRRLEYDFHSRRITLDGGPEVLLSKDANEIRARSLAYQPAKQPGRLGQVTAEGPGWLRGDMADRPGEQLPGEQLEVGFKERLIVRPRGNNQVISLTGGAWLNSTKIGRLDAPEIHFYLREIPKPDDAEQFELRPDRMLACQKDYLLADEEGRLVVYRREGSQLVGHDGPPLLRDNVVINSPQLFGEIEQLGIWFQHVPAPAGAAGQVPATRAATGQGSLPGGIAAPAPGADTNADAPERHQHFKIAGRLLQAELLLPENARGQLAKLSVAGNVHLVETQTAEPGEQPLRVTGDRIDVANADKPHTTVNVIGRPAHFEARGLGITGTNINLNRGTNRLWIDGPGKMDLPVDEDMEGRPLRKAGRLEIAWQERMGFDGRVARFEQSVTATGPQQLLLTETLEVHFHRAIRFADVEADQEPEIEQLLCLGGVSMENRSFDEQTHRQTSYDRMEVADMAINRISGAISAGGPGWITSVRYGSDNPLWGETGQPRAGETAYRNPPAAVAVAPDKPGIAVAGDSADSEEQLRCLEVHFRGSITGNLHQHSLTFRDQVRCGYAPADSWGATLDLDDPDKLGPGSVVLNCDRLTATQMVTPLDNRRAMELEAEGSVVAEGVGRDGSTFTARAIRMTYTEAKGLLIFEGDLRTFARLYRQHQAGGAPSEVAARRILFWPETRRLQLDGAQSFYH